MWFHAEVADYVVPLPMDSLTAAQVLSSLNISAGMIHLDGRARLSFGDGRSTRCGGQYWLRAGYWWQTTTSPMACGRRSGRPFDDFFVVPGLAEIEHIAGKCRVRKPE